MQVTAILLMGFVSSAADPGSMQENVSVENAARHFRIQLYESCRSDRPTYDLIRSTSDQLLSNWQASGRPAEQLDEVLSWYQDASDFDATLPPLPVLPVVEPESEWDARMFFPENDLDVEFSPVTPLPAGAVDVQLEAAAPPTDILSISSDSPADDASPTLAEQWAESPSAILTLGEFALGIAGF